MNNEKAFNILRGITLGSCLRFEEKKELLDWLTDLESEMESDEK